MKPAATQRDTGLGFDGAAPQTTRKPSGNYHKNQWSGHLNDGRLVQMDQQPNRMGNDGSCHHAGYADTGRKPPTMATKGRPSNMDSINMGSGPRGGGRAFEPAARGNYRGNSDRINMGSGPRKGNQQ